MSSSAFSEWNDQRTDMNAERRYSKLKMILEKMDSIIRSSQLAFNQKRIHREYKAVAALDKLLEFQCAKPLEGSLHLSTKRLDANDKSAFILPENDIEFNELLRYLTYELDELAIQEDYSSGLSDSSISYKLDHKSKIKVFSSKRSNNSEDENERKSRRSCRQKQILNKENIKKYFYDIEYKIKMELKKYEIDRKIKSRGESLANTEEFKLTCFTTSKDASNKRNAISSCRGSKLQFDHIKNFFVEVRATAEVNREKKRFSMFSSKIPELEDLTLHDTILESGRNSEEDNSDRDEESQTTTPLKVSFFNPASACFNSKADFRRRNTLHIGSCLFD